MYSVRERRPLQNCRPSSVYCLEMRSWYPSNELWKAFHSNIIDPLLATLIKKNQCNVLIFHECPRCQLLAMGPNYEEWELFHNSPAHGQSARKETLGLTWKFAVQQGHWKTILWLMSDCYNYLMPTMQPCPHGFILERFLTHTLWLLAGKKAAFVYSDMGCICMAKKTLQILSSHEGGRNLADNL